MPRCISNVSPESSATKQIFSAAIDGADPPAFESSGERARKRPAQVLSPQQHAPDPRTAHRRLEPPADRLNLR